MRDLSKKYLPMLSDGSLDDPRSEIIITNGAKFVKETISKYDVIIIDSTDPIGPGEVLFTEDFYRNCKNALLKNGIIITQNGVPYLQDDELKNSYNRLKSSFKNVTFYIAPVPTYVGGFMAFGFATDDDNAININEDEIAKRVKEANLIDNTLYYNSKIQSAAFALPNYIKNLFIKS